MCGCPSRTVTIGAVRAAGKSASSTASSPSASPCRARIALNTRSAEVRQTTSTPTPAASSSVGRREDLGHDHAHADERHLRRLRRLAQAISAGQHFQPAPLAVAPAPRARGEVLVDRTRAQAEVGGLATLAAQPAERVQERPLEVLPEGRLPGGAPRLLEPDRRGDHRLVGSALRSERDPGGRADQDRLAAGIDAERPRLERPVDERVVERADREERLAVPRPGGPELAEQPDEVALRDAQLDVLPVL